MINIKMDKKIISLADLLVGEHDSRVVLDTLKSYATDGSAIINSQFVIRVINRFSLTEKELIEARDYLIHGALVHATFSNTGESPGEKKEAGEYTCAPAYVDHKLPCEKRLGYRR